MFAEPQLEPGVELKYLGPVEDRKGELAGYKVAVPAGAKGFVLPTSVRTMTPEEITAMRDIVVVALNAGAVGFSTTRTLLHRAKDGELAAGTNAAHEELVGIGEALGITGRGLVSVASDMFDPASEFAWMTEIAGSTGRPVTFACLESPIAPDAWRDLIERADTATASGARIVPQVAGRPASLLLGYESSAHPFMFHQAFQTLAGRPLAEIRA